MKHVFAYIRVSTARQGEHGVSLAEQREAIQRYAQRNELLIADWFEERQTAAKRGRPVFARMLKLLVAGRATGLIIHKIDRSTRNLKDWADLGELIDHGIEVHLAHESLDLRSRGGRLTADIQAVVAADYIRNLREETRKGFYGRLKQGLYPRPAPLGYRDVGPGQPKEPDPVRAPLIRTMFELYASGRYTLRALSAELFQRGLRSKSGRRVCLKLVAEMLANPFYIGLCHIARTGQTFEGRHPPLISKPVFDQARAVATGRTVRRVQVHDFQFRLLLRCARCRRHLIGERQKAHVYYRCHNPECRGVSIRETAADQEVRRVLSLLTFSDEQRSQIRRIMRALEAEEPRRRADRSQHLRLRAQQIETRRQRLTDAFLDATIDQDTFEQRKTALLMERRSVSDELEQLGNDREEGQRATHMLELAERASLLYEQALPAEKRELLQIVMSNRDVDGHTPIFTLASPFDDIARRHESNDGDPSRHEVRTDKKSIASWRKWYNQVIATKDEVAESIRSILDAHGLITRRVHPTRFPKRAA